jgi:DNA-binding NarL/FixJ family response regulator
VPIRGWRCSFDRTNPIYARSSDRALLTERTQIQLIAEGLTNKEIAQRLRLAEGTVKVHLHHIYRKLGIANRTALAVLAHTKTLDAA